MAAQPVATPCRGKFRPRVTPQTRPQPTRPKGQLAWLTPFIQLVISFVSSYTVGLMGRELVSATIEPVVG